MPLLVKGSLPLGFACIDDSSSVADIARRVPTILDTKEACRHIEGFHVNDRITFKVNDLGFGNVNSACLCFEEVACDTFNNHAAVMLATFNKGFNLDLSMLGFLERLHRELNGTGKADIVVEFNIFAEDETCLGEAVIAKEEATIDEAIEAHFATHSATDAKGSFEGCVDLLCGFSNVESFKWHVY